MWCQMIRLPLSDFAQHQMIAAVIPDHLFLYLVRCCSLWSSAPQRIRRVASRPGLQAFACDRGLRNLGVGLRLAVGGAILPSAWASGQGRSSFSDFESLFLWSASPPGLRPCRDWLELCAPCLVHVYGVLPPFLLYASWW